MSKGKSRRRRGRSNARYYVAGVALAAVVTYLVASGALRGSGTTTTTQQGSSSGGATTSSTKPVILYVNQGNGAVNSSNFGVLLSTAATHGFNTIFFQVYRSGNLLFTDTELSQFATSAHDQGLKIYFALYITGATQPLPTSIYSDGEDGISLDMSTLPIGAQESLLGKLTAGYSGKTAVTTFDFGQSLQPKPDLLVYETYSASDQQYIHPGIVGSVEVVATSSKQDYQSQVQYALSNSDGVMVFDYAGLLKYGY